MRRALIAATAVCMSFTTLPSLAISHVPQGAYVRKPVSSVDELALHVNKDPVVRNRFSRHFGVKTERLSEYLRDNVVITKVTSSTPSKVYIVTRNGNMVAQKKVLKSGTPVFALKDTGEPLLVLSCGNPVVKQLPPRVKVKAEAAHVYQTVRANEVSLPSPPVTVAALPPIQASPPPVVAPSVPPVVLPPAAVPPVLTRARPNLLPLLPLLGLAANHGSDEDNPPIPPPPMPEPAGAAMILATAVLPAAGWMVRKLRISSFERNHK